MNNLKVKKIDGKISIILNDNDISDQIFDIVIIQKNGTFFARLDVPLDEVNIIQDVKKV